MPSKDKPFQFRSAELAPFYDENYGDRRNIAAKQDLERYRMLVDDALNAVALTTDEAVALWNALNGVNTSHVEMLAIVRQGIISELLEDERIELAHKVKDWSLGQWLAVVDACDRVGAGAYHVDDLVSELKRVGLVE